MDQKTLELLEFNKVLEMLAREASTVLGKSEALKVSPGTVETARDLQLAGKELLEILGTSSPPAMGAVTDVRPAVLAASRGVVLSAGDLRQILDVLLAFESVGQWLDRTAQGYPELSRIRRSLPDLAGLKLKLDRIVDSDGAIKDSASPRLESIRRAYRDHHERLRKRAEELTRRKDFSEVLQEPIVTVRNGRFVLPVKQEYASRVAGLIHDQSASGQTVFIEPQELVEMGNQLRRLELMERDEVERILADASASIGAAGQAIVEGVRALAEFDLGLAKARLAVRWKGAFPRLSDKHVVCLVRAWHPLLTGDPVPQDMFLEQDKVRTLVITGPNMGGKTVALKTCGLLTAMALSGLPCPCSDQSVVGNIVDILCDIGDEQSIEENLSTFSAHITNVIRILRAASPGTLVLIDELGAGTDPEEGAALGLAILEKLHMSGALCVVTSHYSELKVLAQKLPGMDNASVEWDPINMAPTYRLVLGVPGRSNAFMVARMLGLDPDILARARQYMREDSLRLDELLRDLELSSRLARQEAALAEKERQKAEALRQELEAKVRELEDARRGIIEQAKQEAAVILSRARAEFERTLRELREQKKPPTGEQIFEWRQRLRKAQGEFEDTVMAGEPVDPLCLKPGAEVYVAGFPRKGIVQGVPDRDDKVQVLLGTLTVRVPVSELRIAGDGSSLARAQEKASARALALEKARSVSPEVDVRGMTRDEALRVLDKYLDDAVLASLGQVRIVHGRGTGALRQAVSEFLEGHPSVSEFRLGAPGEGGDGVTVVRLKD